MWSRENAGLVKRRGAGGWRGRMVVGVVGRVGGGGELCWRFILDVTFSTLAAAVISGINSIIKLYTNS